MKGIHRAFVAMALAMNGLYRTTRKISRHFPGFPDISRDFPWFCMFPVISHVFPGFFMLSRALFERTTNVTFDGWSLPRWYVNCDYFCAHRKIWRHDAAFLPFKFSRKVSFQSFKKTHQKTKLDLNLTLDLGPLGQTKLFSQGFICHIAQGLCSNFSFIAPKP